MRMRSTISSSFSNFRFASASSWFELYAAFSTFMMLLKTAINQFIPNHIQSWILSKLHDFFFLKPQLNELEVSLNIDQFWEDSSSAYNELYFAAQKYLPSRIARTYTSLRVAVVDRKSKNLEVALEASQRVVDEFEGTKFTWRFYDKHSENGSSSKGRIKPKNLGLILTFNEKHREKAMNRYLPHVLKTYEAMKNEQRTIKINAWDPSYGRWKASDFSHPATFETLALDPEMKKTIINDVELFLKRKEYYRRSGRAWKRGYLLHGPPGTGKSSLIAALAKYLKFDVYDLQLESVSSDNCLKRILFATPKRSIIVIEDIDCSKEVHARSIDDNVLKEKDQKFSLCGMLNSMDGLWSGSEEEKIIIFTTNHKDRIDPALLRAGRMDLHIELSFLKGKAFRVLASNYLDIQGNDDNHHHPVFDQIEELLEKVEVTPSLVAEQLIRNEDPEIALAELLKFLQGVEMQKEAEKCMIYDT